MLVCVESALHLTDVLPGGQKPQRVHQSQITTCSNMHSDAGIRLTARKCPILDVFLNRTLYQILIFIFKREGHNSALEEAL